MTALKKGPLSTRLKLLIIHHPDLLQVVLQQAGILVLQVMIYHPDLLRGGLQQAGRIILAAAY